MRKKNNNTLNGLMIFVFISIAVIMLVTIASIVISYFIGDVPTAQNQEATLLASGIAIIGIAIAVWAGLNIMNAIEKKEVEEINASLKKTMDNINELSDRAESMSKQLDSDEHKIGEIIEERNDIYFGTFIQELINTNYDAMSRFFYREFSNAVFNDYNDFNELIMIEQYFEQVFQQYGEKLPEKNIVRDKANEGIRLTERLIEKRKNEKQTSTGDKKEIIDLYLEYKLCEFHFLLGYMLSGVQLYDAFKRAAIGFENFISNFDFKIPKNKNDQGKFDCDIPDKYLEIAVYISNSIGEAYSKITFEYSNISKQSEPIDYQGVKITKNIVEEYCKKAIYYLELTVELNKKLPEKEVYHRNLGCVYERHDILFGCFGENAKRIIECYRNSFRIAISNEEEMMKRVQKIYHVLLSYYEKYIQYAFKTFNGNKEIKNIFDTVETLKNFIEKVNSYEKSEDDKDILSNENKELFEMAKKYLVEYQLVSEVAIIDHSRFSLQRNLNAFAWTWILALCLSDCKSIKEYYSENLEVYLKKIGETIETLKLMGKNDDYYKELCRRYELLENFVEK